MPSGKGSKRSKYCQTSLKEKKSGSTSVVKMVDAGKINLFFLFILHTGADPGFSFKGGGWSEFDKPKNVSSDCYQCFQC